MGTVLAVPDLPVSLRLSPGPFIFGWESICAKSVLFREAPWLILDSEELASLSIEGTVSGRLEVDPAWLTLLLTGSGEGKKVKESLWIEFFMRKMIKMEIANFSSLAV